MADESSSGETREDVNNKIPSSSIAEHAYSLKPAMEDTELDELLDSALEEFGKPPPSTCDPCPDPPLGEYTTASSDASARCVKETRDDGDSAAAGGDQEKLLSDLFSAEFIAQQQGGMNLDELMKSVMSSDPQLNDHLNKLSQTADASANSDEGMKAFTDTLHETLGSLAQNIDDVKNEDPFSDDELLKMVSGMNFEEGATSESGFLPMMHGMMKNLLSKEVLYPSLKEISSKYPTWLSANKSKLETKEFANYSKQYEMMSAICVAFETEQSSDSDDAKKQRYEEILDLMEQMQNLGQPPKDIVQDMAPGLPFDGKGLPQMPMNPEQCSLM